MLRKTPSIRTLALLLIGMLTLAFNIQTPVSALPAPSTTILEWTLPFSISQPDSVVVYGGKVYFTEQADRIGCLDPSTNTIKEWTVPTAASLPRCITIYEGQVWFTECYGDKIGRLDPSTNTFTEWSLSDAGFASMPYGIAVYGGKVYFTCVDIRRIGCLDPSTNQITEWDITETQPETIPWGIAIDADGKVWFARGPGQVSCRISRLDPSTNTFKEWDLLETNPWHITISIDGKVWFTEYYGRERIGRLDPSTNYLTEWDVPTPVGLSQPYSIIEDAMGNIYFTEYEGNQIGKLKPDGGTTRYVPTLPPVTVTPTSYTSEAASNVVTPATNPVTPASSTVSSTVSGRFTEWDIPTADSKPMSISTEDGTTFYFTEWYVNKIACMKVDLNVEGCMTWYWAGNTGINSTAIGDVDGDGSVEIVTGGYYYDGTRDVSQLVILSGSTLAVEQVRTWYWYSHTHINSVAVGDVDGDGGTEIITGGSYYDGARYCAQLVVWSGSTLAVEQVRTWYWYSHTHINSVAIGDVDGDGSVEIVTGGSYNDGSRYYAQLVVWKGTLALEGVKTWYWYGDTSILSLTVGDVDGDGSVEIVTGGYYYDGTRDVAQLVTWNGSTLAAERVRTWYWTNNTRINSVAIGDVDADDFLEIVSGGYYYDGSRDVAQLTVWEGSTLAPERIRTWYWESHTRIDSVAISDVDGDAAKEIVTGGYHYDGTRNRAQLVLWEGSTLAVWLVKTWHWVSDTLVNFVTVANVGTDTVKITTGGRYYDGIRYRAQLTIWGIP